MKSFKNHFSVIFSLFVLLFSFEAVNIVNKVINNYEENLVDDYSIVVVSSKDLDTDALKRSVSLISSIEEIDSSNVISRLESNLPTQSIALLKTSMPKFYTVKLEKFPSSKMADDLKNSLLKYEDITKVELFSKTHDKIYKVLQLLHVMVIMLSFLIAIVSLLLIFKQMRIWIYEHQNRIDIMTLFGAPFLTKSAVLYKLAIIDSFLATLITLILFSFIHSYTPLLDLLSNINVTLSGYDFIERGIVLLGISLLFSIVTTTFVVMKIKTR
ncbi:MAG: cell division protein FtsX [Campylobacteraceae bacterium]